MINLFKLSNLLYLFKNFKFGYFIIILYILIFGFLVVSNIFPVKASYEGVNTEPFNIFGGGWEALSAVISTVCYFIYSIPIIVLAIWIYFDGKKWQVENPLLWAFLSLIAFPIFVIIYFLSVRKDAKKKLEKSMNYNNTSDNTTDNSNNY